MSFTKSKFRTGRGARYRQTNCFGFVAWLSAKENVFELLDKYMERIRNRVVFMMKMSENDNVTVSNIILSVELACLYEYIVLVSIKPELTGGSNKNVEILDIPLLFGVNGDKLTTSTLSRLFKCLYSVIVSF